MENLSNYIYEELGKMFPDAMCELDYNNPFELIVAVTLSAQTTDKRVNIVTKDLFKKYPSALELMNAEYDDVKEIIKSIGLTNSKTKNIINLSKELVTRYNGIVPQTMEDLITLPGVGRKTASVVLAVAYNIPAIAVDTHVSRVSNRLGLSKSNDVLKIENDLKNIYDEDQWVLVHHRLLFFGRYFCKAKNPLCDNCKFKELSIYW